MTPLDEFPQPEDIRRLDQPDAAAWQRVRRLEAPPLENPVADAQGPFECVLHGWRAFQDPEAKRAVAGLCTLDLIEALERCATEPLGYTGAALEAALARSFVDHSTAWLDSVHAWIRDLPRVEPQGRPLELETLALMYQARTVLALGDKQRANRLRKEAEALLPAEPSAEMQSRRLEMASAFLWHSTKVSRAFEDLDQRLPSAAIGRRVNLLRLKAHTVSTGQARRVLHRALALLPDGYALRVRLGLALNLLELAVYRQDLTEADALLAESDALFAHPAISNPVARAERDWLRGRMALLRGCPHDAWDLLRRSAGIFATYSVDGVLDFCLQHLVEAWLAIEPTRRHHDEAHRLLEDLKRRKPPRSLHTSMNTLRNVMTARSRLLLPAALDGTEPTTAQPAGWPFRTKLSRTALVQQVRCPVIVAVVHHASVLFPIADQFVEGLADHDWTAAEPPQRAFETALTAWCAHVDPVLSALDGLTRFFDSPDGKTSAYLHAALDCLLDEKDTGPKVPSSPAVHLATLHDRPWAEVVPLHLVASIVRCPSQDFALALWRFASAWSLVREDDRATATGGLLRIYLSIDTQLDRSASMTHLEQLAALLGSAVEPADPIHLLSGSALHRTARHLRIQGLIGLSVARRLERMMAEESAKDLAALSHALTHHVAPGLTRAIDRLRTLSAQVGCGSLGGVVERLAAGDVSLEQMFRRALAPEPSAPTARPATGLEPSDQAARPSRVIDHRIDSLDDCKKLAPYLALADAWAQTRGARVQRLPLEAWLAHSDGDAVIRLHVPAEMDDAEVEALQETLSALARFEAG